MILGCRIVQIFLGVIILWVVTLIPKYQQFSVHWWFAVGGVGGLFLVICFLEWVGSVREKGQKPWEEAIFSNWQSDLARFSIEELRTLAQEAYTRALMETEADEKQQWMEQRAYYMEEVSRRLKEGRESKKPA